MESSRDKTNLTSRTPSLTSRSGIDAISNAKQMSQKDWEPTHLLLIIFGTILLWIAIGTAIYFIYKKCKATPETNTNEEEIGDMEKGEKKMPLTDVSESVEAPKKA